MENPGGSQEGDDEAGEEVRRGLQRLLRGCSDYFKGLAGGGLDGDEGEGQVGDIHSYAHIYCCPNVQTFFFQTKLLFLNPYS